MTEAVKVPDPVHERLAREAAERDVTMGAVIAEWMHDADRFETLITEGRVEFEVDE